MQARWKPEWARLVFPKEKIQKHFDEGQGRYWVPIVDPVEPKEESLEDILAKQVNVRACDRIDRILALWSCCVAEIHLFMIILSGLGGG